MAIQKYLGNHVKPYAEYLKDREKEQQKDFANMFYEVCAGSANIWVEGISDNIPLTTGCTSFVPYSEILFGMTKEATKRQDKRYAATKTEFAQMLRIIADNLEESN